MLPFSIFSKYKQVLISVISQITAYFSKTNEPTIKKGPLWSPGLSPQNEPSNPTGSGFLLLSSCSLLSPEEEPNHTFWFEDQFFLFPDIFIWRYMQLVSYWCPGILCPTPKFS